MAIGGYRTATEVSKPVRRKSGGAGAGMLNFGGSIPRLTGAGEGFQAMARMGADVQRFGGSLRRSAEEQADKDAAAAAQQLYQRQGTSADGITDEWTKAANERVRDVGAGLDSMTRERLKERMAPWLAGRRENLMGHQAREVRRGRIMEFENDMTATAASETNDILAQVRGEEQGWDDEKTSAAGLGEEAAAGADERIAKERKAVAQGHLTQLGLVAASHEERFDQAVKDGLFSPEEAAARKRAYRGNTVRTAIGALIADGRADSAEAMLDELEGNKEMLSEQCGLDAKELARFREGVRNVRARREAERKRAEAEAKEAARDAAREKEVKLHLQPIPADAEGQAAHFEQMAADYAALAQDPSLDASTRLTYAKTAESLGYRSMSRLEEEKRERKAAAREAKAEAREQMREVREQATAERKANEDGLARALCQLQMMELEGSIQQKDADEAQAAIWRKFHVCAYDGKVSPSFMHSFQSRMTTRLSEQERNAMRKFYQAFGYSADLDKGGEPTASGLTAARKDSESYYAPLVEDGVKVESRKTRIKAADLLKYGDSLLRTLRTLGPDMNREGVVEREIARLKTGWMKGELDKNRDATVRSVMDMQREARTRQEMAQPEKRSEEDDGRKEHDKPAK